MMYLAHYGMSEAPFGLTPNTAFYVDLPIHQQAMAVLTVALAQGEGFIKVTGEVGTGKTLLCRKLLHEAPEHFALAYLPDPHLSPLELRWALALELGLKHSGNIDPQQLGQLLQRQLLLLAQQQKQVVLLIDEAQALPDETLETLRLLTNLETEQRKLLQVVLFGQPELNQRLALYQFRQLRQRISFSYDLSVLNRAQVACYVRARLQLAGVTTPIFSQPALWLLHFYSRGIPRLINILAHKALMLGFGKATQRLGYYQIVQAAHDTDDVQAVVRWWPWSGVLGSAVLAALWYWLPGGWW